MSDEGQENTDQRVEKWLFIEIQNQMVCIRKRLLIGLIGTMQAQHRKVCKMDIYFIGIQHQD